MKKTFVRMVLAVTYSAFAITLLCAQPARAQHGINSDGTDFFVGFMPGIVHGAYFSTGNPAAYFLICSYTDSNRVVIHYFIGPGSEVTAKTIIINRGFCSEVLIDPASIVPTTPGETLEYKCAHITSEYPISVQVYTEGSCNGNMYQAIPTAALGKSYVVAAYNDNPLVDNPGFVNRDSSSSDFMIIAPYDNTVVTFVPNSTTKSGITGVKSGPGSNGTTHTASILMQRGQVYWVRSSCHDPSQDESGSTVVSNKPIAVLGGQERAMIGYPYGYWTTLDNDIRNEVVQEMTPAQDWGTDYPSIPTMPASITDVTVSGDGDMYRIFTNDVKGVAMNYWEGDSLPYQQFGPDSVGLYQLPCTEFDNITEPVDLLTESKSTDLAGNLKKFYAVQYLYFQGHHDWQPNRGADIEKEPTPQSGGGDQALDQTTYRAESEMDLVPIDRWRMYAMFMVPPNSQYNGFQFINVITNKDSLHTIFVSRNNTTAQPIGTFITPLRTYQIPRHPELIGITIKLPSGTYLIYGNTPFECYSYGRTETAYKNVYGYAAPCGEAYGSHAQPNSPQADITPSCGEWIIRIHESGTGGGIADVMLLNDPDGFTTRPAQISYNCRIIGTGSNPYIPTSPPFEVGDTSLSVVIQVNNPTQNAYAALYAVDLSGNDTVIQLSYTAPSIALSTNKVIFPDTVVLNQQCSTATLYVKSTGNFLSVNALDSLSGQSLFRITTNPPLPAILKGGDSVVFNICYTPQDTNLHTDSVIFTAGCVGDTLHFQGKGLTPIILAGDYDFGNVSIGDTLCHNISIRNIGNAPLILDNNFILSSNPDYTFEGPIPDTIQPENLQNLRFCFHPSQVGSNSSQMNWGTNITGIYAHHNKDTSLLLGMGIASGVTPESHPAVGISIHPNPVTDIATVSLADTPEAMVRVYDVLGREVGSFRVFGSYEWNTGNLPAGTYIVRAEASGMVVSRRIIKQ